MATLRDVLSHIAEQLRSIGDSALAPDSSSTVGTVAEDEAAGEVSECEQILNTIPATRYGCHDLQRGDRDDGSVWGGVENAPVSVCPDEDGAADSDEDEEGEGVDGGGEQEAPRHVWQLQYDLSALGFGIVGNPDGVFGRTTEMAVREFQAYAKMTRVARIRAGVSAEQRGPAHEVAQLGMNADGTLSQYVDSLEPVCNAARYTGPVCGVVNADTRRALRYWIENNWRCPVIIEAWNVANGNRASLYQDGGEYAVNLWTNDDLRSRTPRVFYRDFTTYYSYPANRDRNAMHALGEYAEYGGWYGPVSLPPRHCWDEAELLPEKLIGNPAPTGATLSTFKVIRAAAEQECLGHFDSITAYDRAVISVGPCHWTICLLRSNNNNVDPGEMCGLLSLFEYENPDAFAKTCGEFGLKASESWVDANGVPNGAALWSSGQKKFASHAAWQQADGSYAALPNDKRDYEYLRNWHWFFRWVMAGRTIEGYQRCMWTMARIRVRDVLATPWGDAIHGHSGLTVGDVFTSEKAVAMIHRLHIYTPARIAEATAAGSYLRGDGTDPGALGRAEAETPDQAGAGNTAGNSLDWTGGPAAWGDEHEAALIRGLMRTVEARNPWPPAPPGGDREREPGIRVSTRTVRDWPTWSLTGYNPRGFALANSITAGGLSEARGSFDFDTAGLPPAP